MRICVLIILAPLLAGPAAAAPRADPIDPDELAAFADGFFGARMAELHVPGAVLAVVQHGQVLLLEGYGLADVEGGVPMDPEATVVQVGSVSKPFVATAVMQQVERGALDLHEDVNRLLTGVQVDDAYPDPVTLHHLLTHTAGFDDVWFFLTDPAEVQPLGEFLADHLAPRVIPPGEVTAYSSHGYDLAAYLVEEATGLPFHEYVAENVFRPLGMERSGYLLPGPLPQGLAKGYYYTGGAYVRLPAIYDSGYPSGSLVSTAADMARFLVARLESGGGCVEDACILGADTLAEMQRRQFGHHPRLPGMAYGLMEMTINGVQVLGHGGATRGSTSDLVLLPEEGLGYFLSHNHECTGAAASFHAEFRQQFFDRFYPGEPSAPVPAETETPSDLSRLEGTYRRTRRTRSTVEALRTLDLDQSLEAGGQGLLFNGREYVEVEPLLFQQVDGEGMMAFREDGAGRITYLFVGSMAFERLAWYETGRFHRALLAGWGWLWGAVAAVGLLLWIVRRLRRRPPLPRSARAIHRLAAAMGLLDLAFLISLGGLFWRSRAATTAWLVLPLVSCALAAALLLVAGRAWLRRDGPLAARIYGSLVVLLGVLFLVYLAGWNLLGFWFG